MRFPEMELSFDEGDLSGFKAGIDNMLHSRTSGWSISSVEVKIYDTGVHKITVSLSQESATKGIVYQFLSEANPVSASPYGFIRVEEYNLDRLISETERFIAFPVKPEDNSENVQRGTTLDVWFLDRLGPEKYRQLSLDMVNFIQAAQAYEAAQIRYYQRRNEQRRNY